MKTTVLRLIDEHIAQELATIKEHEQIAGILAPLEGKPINGQTLNKKRLSAFEVENGYSFTFEWRYGLYHIKGKFEHLIGYAENPVIILSDSEEYGKRGFGYFDNCYFGAAKQRIKALQDIDVEKMVVVFSGIRDSFENLRVLFGDLERNKLGSYNNPIYYDLLRCIHDDDKNNQGVKLSSFYFLRK